MEDEEFDLDPGICPNINDEFDLIFGVRPVIHIEESDTDDDSMFEVYPGYYGPMVKYKPQKENRQYMKFNKRWTMMDVFEKVPHLEEEWDWDANGNPFYFKGPAGTIVKWKCRFSNCSCH